MPGGILKCRHRMCELCDFSPELQFAFPSIHTDTHSHEYRQHAIQSCAEHTWWQYNLLCAVCVSFYRNWHSIPEFCRMSFICIHTFAQVKLYREHQTACLHIYKHTCTHTIIIMLNMVTVSRKNSPKQQLELKFIYFAAKIYYMLNVVLFAGVIYFGVRV